MKQWPRLPHVTVAIQGDGPDYMLDLDQSHLHGALMWRQRAGIDSAIRYLRLYGQLLDALIERDADGAATEIIRDAKIEKAMAEKGDTKE